jgi:hypothetical protein
MRIHFAIRDHVPASLSADLTRQFLCCRLHWLPGYAHGILQAPASQSTEASCRPFRPTRGPCLGSSPPADHLSASRLAVRTLLPSVDDSPHTSLSAGLLGSRFSRALGSSTLERNLLSIRCSLPCLTGFWALNEVRNSLRKIGSFRNAPKGKASSRHVSRAYQISKLLQ